MRFQKKAISASSPTRQDKTVACRILQKRSFVMSMEAGFIGLGSMGLPMATNLIAAGAKLRVYNRTASKAAPLVEKGATLAASAGEAATAGGIVITMLADDAAVENVVMGADGIAARLGPGGIYVSMSTIAPATARRMAAYHAEHGSIYVAAA